MYLLNLFSYDSLINNVGIVFLNFKSECSLVVFLFLKITKKFDFTILSFYQFCLFIFGIFCHSIHFFIQPQCCCTYRQFNSAFNTRFSFLGIF